MPLTMISYGVLFIEALVFTILLEMAAFFIFMELLLGRSSDIPVKDIVFSVIFCSFTTLPYVWFLFPEILGATVVCPVVSEFFAVTVEAFIYFFVLKIGLGRSLAVSLICNAFSLLAGLLAARYIWSG